MASAGRCSELQGLVFDQKYSQFTPKGAGVTLYFSPEFMRKNQKPNQVNNPWYIPALPTGTLEFGTPNCLVRALIKDNKAGKELSAASISRWICTTILDSHAALLNNKSIPGSVKAHEGRTVATSLHLNSGYFVAPLL